jgi:transcription elongation factor Elf1
MRLYCSKCGKYASSDLSIDVTVKAGVEIFCERCARERTEAVVSLKKMLDTANECLEKLLSFAKQG